MWKFSVTATFVGLVLANVKAEYTITSSNEVGSYQYPAPPKSQQLFEPPSPQHRTYAVPHTYQNQYQGYRYTPSSSQQSSVILKQLSSPVLDNEAFGLNSLSKGYKFDNAPAFNAALKANSRSSKTTFHSTVASGVPSRSASTPVIGSLNVKLPLPIGVTPLNIAPLPLQAGAPYTAIPNPLTSYGTVYPQRRRRYASFS